MDAITDVLNDLRSPDLSIRGSALAQIEDFPWSEELQAELEKLAASETDTGLSFQIDKILARSTQKDRPKATAADIEKMLAAPKINEMKLALMIESVKRSEATLAGIALRDAHWENFSSRLLPSVLKFMKKHGSYEDAANIEMLCRHHDPRVLSAAIEALEKISPDQLKDLIVPLLINPNIGIRSRAVRILYRWDPAEALRHFEAMLFSAKESEKQAALFHAFFFPFKEIESLLLKFLSIENNTDLIKKAGLIFMANPDRQTPARLLEARQACAGEKFALIDNILKGVLNSLHKAGIVKAAPAQMLEALESHFHAKRISLFIERYSIGLKSGQEETRFKSAIKICELAKRNVEEAKTIIDKFLISEQNEQIREKVRQYYLMVPESQPREKKKELVSFTHEQQLKILTSITADTFEPILSQASAIFSELDSDCQGALIKAIESFGNKSHTEFLSKNLKKDNPQVLAATIDALGTLNPESLHPYLPQLIKHSSEEVQLTALKIFALFDKQQAISLLDKMTSSMKSLLRRQAIFCLGYLDFPSVRQIMLKTYKNESDNENIEQISSILRSNASVELFVQLYSDWKSCKPSRAEDYEALCGQIVELVVEAEPALSKIELYQLAAEKLEVEQEAQKQRKTYKLEKIQKIRESSEGKRSIDPSLVRFSLLAYSVGAVLTALIWFLFMAPSVPVDKGDTAVSVQTRLRGIEQTKTVRGIVVNANSANNSVRLANDLENGRFYVIVFPQGHGRLPEKGTVLHAQVLTTQESESETVAELIMSF